MGRYLAINIGADKGNHILGYLENGKLLREEIHSFEIVPIEKDGALTLDLEALFTEIKKGLIKCMELNKLPIFVSLNAWGADFVLLDHEDRIIREANIVPEGKLDINGELKAMKEKNPECDKKVNCLLLIRDYFNFLLTGRKYSEYTNVVHHTGLLHPITRNWDKEQLTLQGVSPDILMELSYPNCVVGNLTLEVTEETGYDCIIMQSVEPHVGGAYYGILMDEPPFEAAALASLLNLLICSHELTDLTAAKECLRKTLECQEN